MIILTLRTDQPTASIALYNDETLLERIAWEAHRELARTIHTKTRSLLAKHDYTWQDIAGLVCYEGPGSFTGLRIGLTVANTLAHELAIPIVGTTTEDWERDGVQKLLDGTNQTVVLPHYGREPHITTPKK